MCFNLRPKFSMGPQAILVFALFLSSCGTGDDAWKARNDEVVRQHNLKMRDRVMPRSDVPASIEAGTAVPLEELPVVSIEPGISARLVWLRGALLEYIEFEPEVASSPELLESELFIVGQEGAATVVIDDQPRELAAGSIVYLPEGTRRSVKAGPAGWKAIEVFSPVRADHLKLAGMEIRRQVAPSREAAQPSLEPGQVYNLKEIQFTPLTPPIEGASHKRSAANSRLAWGKNVQLSFVRMDPFSTFPLHIHPEDQLMITLRGSLRQTMVDAAYEMNGADRHVALLPGGMSHGAELGEFGADALDVFWPVRSDYVELAARQERLFREVVADGATPIKLADGFTFNEGPTWLKGVLFFSDMFFKDPAGGDWTGDPKRSRLIRMEQDGRWQVLSRGMQTNGTIASLDGSLLVCDMFGHRVIEVNPDNGSIIRTVLSRVGNVAIDGPNDLVMDAKGGIYVTDPQFTPAARKSQPGTQVYYVAPDGSAKVVIPAGEYAMPNGVGISPDGRTFYVNNTWLTPGENFVWAYDVHEDGSLSNKRKFAELNRTPEVLNATNPVDRFNSQADGMAVDMDGRLYVATLSGVQIFNSAGVYVGTIWSPEAPISCTFGGEKYDQLYMVSPSAVWRIQTNVKGFRHPDKYY